MALLLEPYQLGLLGMHLFLHEQHFFVLLWYVLILLLVHPFLHNFQVAYDHTPVAPDPQLPFVDILNPISWD